MHRFLTFCKSQNKWFFKTFLTLWPKLLGIYYFNITIDVYSTYKQAIMLYGAHMQWVELSLKKPNVLSETQ